MLFPPPPSCAFLWCAANVIPAITAAYPNGSDKIINCNKTSLSRDGVFWSRESDTRPLPSTCRSHVAARATLHVRFTADKYTHSPIYTHRDTHGTANAEQRQKTSGTPRRLVSALRYTNGSSRRSLSRNTWSADQGLCGLSVWEKHTEKHCSMPSFPTGQPAEPRVSHTEATKPYLRDNVRPTPPRSRRSLVGKIQCTHRRSSGDNSIRVRG